MQRRVSPLDYAVGPAEATVQGPLTTAEWVGNLGVQLTLLGRVIDAMRSAGDYFQR